MSDNNPDRRPPPNIAVLETYTVALLKIIRRDGTRTVIHNGSASLVNVGGVKGLLTAGHVLAEIERDESFGMVSSVGPGKNAETKIAVIEPNAILRNWAGAESPEGPDIGFLRLPLDVVHWFDAHRAFYTYSKRFEAHAEGRRPDAVETRVLAGMVGEGSEVAEPINGEINVKTQFYMFEGQIEWPNQRLRDMGSVEFFPARSELNPSNYKGVSGGGLWAISQKGDQLDRILYGVAYFQNPEEPGGYRTIMCHDPKWVYDWLVSAVEKAFPDEFKPFTS